MGCLNAMAQAKTASKVTHNGFIYYRNRWKCPVCFQFNQHKVGCKMEEGFHTSQFLNQSDNIADEESRVVPEKKSSEKDTNPKDAVGVRKAPISTVSGPVILELGLAMLEGARKYGRHNYRESGVRSSVYYDATFRHLVKWWEFEDLDPDSGLSHITKAIASLVVLRDAMINDNWVDDRPPPGASKEFFKNLDKLASDVIDKFPEAKDPFTRNQNGR